MTMYWGFSTTDRVAVCCYASRRAASRKLLRAELRNPSLAQLALAPRCAGRIPAPGDLNIHWRSRFLLRRRCDTSLHAAALC